MKQELILCVETTKLKQYTDESNIYPFADYSDLPVNDNDIWFLPRPVAEERPDFRQIIPYIVLRCNDNFLTYKRTTKAGESRLHDMYSLGFGGHISIDDAVLNGPLAKLDETIRTAASREVKEEIGIDKITKKTPLGIINDISNDVGRVHLGLVEIWDIDPDDFKLHEQELSNLELQPLTQMIANKEYFETWSQMVINCLKG